jgi:Xaa-Pro aminopeptidase
MLADVIQRSFEVDGLSAEGRPDVGAGANAADPHYSIGSGGGAPVTADTVLLIDLWAQVRDAESAPFADSTWMAFTGRQPPPAITGAFGAVRDARDAAIGAIGAAVEAHRQITGAEVDRISRHVLEEAKFGAAIVHRTGHSLGIDHVHGMGTNLDDIEFPDERSLLVGSGVTIEPGLYFPGKFGVRCEVSAIVQPEGLEVTTECQSELTLVAG